MAQFKLGHDVWWGQVGWSVNAFGDQQITLFCRSGCQMYGKPGLQVGDLDNSYEFHQWMLI